MMKNLNDSIPVEPLKSTFWRRKKGLFLCWKIGNEELGIEKKTPFI